MTYQEGFWSKTSWGLILLILLILASSWQLVRAASQPALLFQEIQPRPDNGSPELLTLYNPTSQTVDLTGWLLADTAKQAKPINLPAYQLAAGQSWTVEAKTLGLNLNNDSEELFLWQPDGQLVDTVSYAKAPLNVAYRRADDGWHWADEIAKTESVAPQTEPLLAATPSSTATTTQTVQGIVTALPYQLSNQYLYITYPDNSAGLKIYCYYKLWPQLTLGSSIEVTGQLVSTTQEIKLNIKGQQDIKVLTAAAPLIAKTITTQDINQLASGQLIVLTGKLSAKNQSTLYLTDDFGELLVQLKTGSGLKNGDFTVGQTYQITGLALDNNGYRLVPRQPSDVVKIHAVASTSATTTLDFTADKKPATSPIAWIIGLMTGLILAWLAFRVTKKQTK